MTDKHIAIDDIERFLLDPDGMSPSIKIDIQTHLSLCALCSEQFNIVETYYHEVRALDNHEITKQAHAILSKVSCGADARSRHIIPLFPENRKTRFHQLKPSVIALAAQQTVSVPRFVHSGTLVSADEQTILRFIRDNETGTHIMQVHSDNPVRYENVIVTFDSVDGAFVTDQSGEAVLQDLPDTNFNTFLAYIHTPCIEFTFDDDIMTEFDERGRCMIRTGDDSGLVLMSPEEYADPDSGPSSSSEIADEKRFVEIEVLQDEKYSFALLIHQQNSKVVFLEDNKGKFERECLAYGTIVKLFA